MKHFIDLYSFTLYFQAIYTFLAVNINKILMIFFLNAIKYDTLKIHFVTKFPVEKNLSLINLYFDNFKSINVCI
jgi:hypothetical protein